MSWIKKWFFLFWILLVLAIITYLLYSQTELLDRWFPERNQEELATETRQISIWMPEWSRAAAQKDLEKLHFAPASIQAFGVYFDKGDKLYVPSHMREMISTIRDAGDRMEGPSFKLFMSLVNDIVNEGGSSVQKDSDLVYRLTSTPEARKNHIEEIVNLALENKVDGVEIDYERIDANAWPGVEQFVAQLYQALRLEGLALRVVLEIRAPLETLSLPSGPDYSVMAYNLYGYHSGPGPKADYAMIGKIAARLDGVPGGASIAFSAGGFDWSEDGIIRAITELEAEELAIKALKPTERDRDSGALTFEYLDEKNVRHTVWYADGETMSLWMQAAEKRGVHRFDLWRLGGLSDQTLEVWNRQSLVESP